MKVSKKKRLSAAGMTLVETVVAMAVLCVAALMMTTGFLAASDMVRRGVRIQRAVTELSARVESESDTASGTASALSVSSAAAQQSILGRYVTFTDDKTGIEYTVFIRE